MTNSPKDQRHDSRRRLDRRLVWSVSALWLLVASAASAAGPMDDARDFELIAALPQGWEMTDFERTPFDVDDVTTGSAVYQAMYQKVAKTPDGDMERATLILRITKGPRPFSTNKINLRRIRNEYLAEFDIPESQAQEIQVVPIKVGDNQPALEIQSTGEITGIAFNQRLLIMTGAHFTYVMSYQAFKAHWAQWEPEWEQIVSAIQLPEPYSWGHQKDRLIIIAIVVFAAVMLGSHFRWRRIQKKLRK